KPALFGVQFLDLPTLPRRGFVNTPGQFAVAAIELRINPGRDARLLVFEHRGFSLAGELRYFLAEGRRIYAADPQRDRAGQLGTLLQFRRRSVRHDLSAVNDDGARAGGLDFLQDVRR